jgi:hypothetical protein
MKKTFLAILAVLLCVSFADAQIISIAKKKAGGGPAPGTLLLGNNNTTTSGDDFTGNANTAYYMCPAAAASATVTTAYYYDRLGGETDPVHVCIWNSSGTLLGCSGNITMTGAAGWRSVSWSGPTLTASTTYCIGVVSGGYFWTNYDTSSPAIPMCEADTTGQTFSSEGDVPTTTCERFDGSFTIYVTN